ncbi:FecR domain-containing protein [Pedobacter sp. ASV1-7]|uniref:FecR family protein n=1 Tax=Pedobacter sp. ASV1-7 TaxID=3145237 RepID=UPI0032E8E4AE
MDKRRLQKLLIAYSTNEIQLKDYNELMDLVSISNHNEELYAFMEKVWNSSPMEKSFSDLQSDMLFQRIIGDRRFKQLPTQKKSKGIKLWHGIAAAAVILITMSVGVFFYTSKNVFIGSGKSDFTKYDLKPGGNHAVLTLADGSKIELTGAATGKIAEQAGISIQKTADGQIVYEVSSSAKPTGENAAEQGFNMVSTPKGGQYQVNLPDGTRVWLNASSSLKFSAAFTGYKKRVVELTGEGYFEVAKVNKPFIVETKEQEVEVLGTHFNISSYANDGETKTTLLEGAVKVSTNNVKNNTEDIILKPGQQALLKAGQLNIKAVDAGAEVDWKSGYFIFKNEDMRSIMRKIERWYDVEIVFAKDFNNRSYEGSISRFKNVSEVLRKFELTGNIHFKMEERRITVMP